MGLINDIINYLSSQKQELPYSIFEKKKIASTVAEAGTCRVEEIRLVQGFESFDVPLLH